MARRAKAPSPLVGVIMGSRSDWQTLEYAAEILRQFNVPYETRVVSAHRTPKQLYAYASAAEKRGLRAIIAGAGGAAHLPGMTAALTSVPVLAVPVQSSALNGVDSLLSIVQMPAGIPVATFAIGKPGAINAALFAIAQLSQNDKNLAGQLRRYRQRQTQDVLAKPDPSQA